MLGGHAYRPLPIPITTATTTGKSIYIGPRIVYQQNYGGYAGHGYAPTTTGTGSTGQVVVTKAVTRTVTNTIIKEVYTRITEKYMPIIEYFTQYLMTWLTPSGMCQNGLCGLNPSLLMQSLKAGMGNSGNGINSKEWGTSFMCRPLRLSSTTLALGCR